MDSRKTAQELWQNASVIRMIWDTYRIQGYNVKQTVEEEK